MTSLEKLVDLLTPELPDPEGARRFYLSITSEHPKAISLFQRDQGLLSDALALAAWSPFLGTTLVQHPEYLVWLARERTHRGVVSTEQFKESLGRFALTNSRLELPVLLARFRRRELLRTYIRDIRGTFTVVEITEELSNLAGAVLEYALDIARQKLENDYGVPGAKDARGRKGAASFCIVGLGKLGALELNYASDIDLLYLYSEDGKTSGTGPRGQLTNREYFVKLGESVTQLIGRPGGEGAPYRVDLRLRPYGREGVLASSLEESVSYYREKAEPWERQALIRSRSAAGADALYARFAARLLDCVYDMNVSVARALTAVQLAKTKIDRQYSSVKGGLNVKLGIGGIREIEFIVQALQLAFGGRDPWLRERHTLISLGRLADRELISERERADLSSAYTFLRTVEHRLQMEEGLQTHTVPGGSERRALLARRMHFKGAMALNSFDAALSAHASNVRLSYARIFGAVDGRHSAIVPSHTLAETTVLFQSNQPADDYAVADITSTQDIARLLYAHVEGPCSDLDPNRIKHMAGVLLRSAHRSPNPHHALRSVERLASYLEKSDSKIGISDAGADALVQLCGTSDFLGDVLASNPSLAVKLTSITVKTDPADYCKILSSLIESPRSYREELADLRRAWAPLHIEIAALDVTCAISMKEVNARLTALAAAAVDAACLIATRELSRKFGKFDSEPRLYVMGLGRFGGAGMDYGSDLDLVMVFDDASECPVRRLSRGEFYGKLVETLTAALSSVTRDGYLYRVDLRLRPDGGKGLTCSGAQAFTEYLRERSVAWEWLAYVKVRAAAGDIEKGRGVEDEARRIIHKRARQMAPESLCAETRRVRERLEIEKTSARRGPVDFKYESGGMLDVYFATRYLQLRDNVPDEGDDRSTLGTIQRLRAARSLGEEDFVALKEGYVFLRGIDHYVRLALGRSTRLPRPGHHVLKGLVAAVGCESEEELNGLLRDRMSSIRNAYHRITTISGN